MGGRSHPITWGDNLPETLDVGNVYSLYQYPRSRLGMGLLLLRASLGLLLVSNHWTFSLATSSALSITLLALAFGIWFGLFTPLLSLTAFLMELGVALTACRTPPVISVAILGLCLATAMLGAGGYSVDGLLFGKRRVLL